MSQQDDDFFSIPAESMDAQPSGQARQPVGGSLKRAMRGFGLLAVLAAAVPISIFFWIKSKTEPIHGEPFLARVTVDMTVYDEPVHIDRIVECKTFVVGHNFLSPGSMRDSVAWAPTVAAIGQRLSDGSAIMMWMPYRCQFSREKNEATGEFGPRRIIQLDDYQLMMAWTPDGNTVPYIDLFHQKDFNERPASPVRNVRVGVSGAPAGATADPPDDFAFFTRHKFEDEEQPWKPRTFYGYVATPIPEKVWSGVLKSFDQYWPGISEAFLDYLNTIKEPQIVDRIILIDGVPTNRVLSMLTEQALGSARDVDQTRDARGDEANRPYGQFFERYRSGWNVENADNSLKIQLGPPSESLRLYPVDFTNSTASRNWRYPTAKILKFRDKEFRPPNTDNNRTHPTNFLFDPKSRQLIMIDRIHF